MKPLASLAAFFMLACIPQNPQAPALGPVLSPMLAPAPPPPGTPTVVMSCKLTEPPPVTKRALSTKPRGCPDQFAACLSISDALMLTQYLEEMQSWSREAWAKCGTRTNGR